MPTSFGTVRVYRFDGPPQGTPVVLLPGRNASTPMWGANLPPLLEHRTVYSVDLLGEAGMSVQRQAITGPDDQAQWFDETLAGLGLDRVHLMGVSIGGWTAANYAIRRPGRAASLALLDPAIDVRADPGQDDRGVDGDVPARRAGRGSSPGAALDLRRRRDRRRTAGGRADRRRLDRLHAAQADAQAVHR